MQPYEQRVIDEKSELDTKLEKLKVFIDSDMFQKLGHIEKDLLIWQAQVMCEYSTILERRIAVFMAR